MGLLIENMDNPLLLLPSDLVLQISRLLNPFDLKNLCVTCQLANSIYSQKAVWCSMFSDTKFLDNNLDWKKNCYIAKQVGEERFKKDIIFLAECDLIQTFSILEELKRLFHFHRMVVAMNNTSLVFEPIHYSLSFWTLEVSIRAVKNLLQFSDFLEDSTCDNQDTSHDLNFFTIENMVVGLTCGVNQKFEGFNHTNLLLLSSRGSLDYLLVDMDEGSRIEKGNIADDEKRFNHYRPIMELSEYMEISCYFPEKEPDSIMIINDFDKITVKISDMCLTKSTQNLDSSPTIIKLIPPGTAVSIPITLIQIFYKFPSIFSEFRIYPATPKHERSFEIIGKGLHLKTLEAAYNYY
jgi:hypothetical protein